MNFVSDRIRMCRIKRLGRRQQFHWATQRLEQDLPGLHKKAVSERVRREKERQKKEWDRDKRMRWRVMAKNANFGKTRDFIGNRIRMCRLSRLGRRQRFERAAVKLGKDLPQWYWKAAWERKKTQTAKVRRDNRRNQRIWARLKAERGKMRARAKERVEHKMKQRRRVELLLRMKVDKKELSGDIDASLAAEGEDLRGSWIGLGGLREEGLREKKFRLRGGGGLIIWGDGKVWRTPWVQVYEMNVSWEQRRRKLFERWEAPPPGPPSLALGVRVHKV